MCDRCDNVIGSMPNNVKSSLPMTSYHIIITHIYHRFANKSKLLSFRYSFYLNNVHKIAKHHNILYCNFVILV